MTFELIVEWVTHALEGMGVGVVSFGALAALAGFGRRLVAGNAFEAEGSVLRERLGRATLLGLEFLVAADIIATVAAPTPAKLLMLAGVILLRTFLSATLTMEVEGRWPWNLTAPDRKL